MDALKISLDKHLTSNPFDNDDYWEEVCESFTEDFWEENEKSIMDGQIDKWINQCENSRELNPKYAAKLIERAHKIYLK